MPIRNTYGTGETRHPSENGTVKMYISRKPKRGVPALRDETPPIRLARPIPAIEISGHWPDATH